MRLELRSLVALGDLENERLTLRVLQDTNLADYLVFRGKFEDDELLTDVNQPIWFPYKPVEKGDLVVIYTKKGKASEKKLSTGKIAHFYYLNEKSSIWKEEFSAPVILDAPTWQFQPVEKLVK